MSGRAVHVWARTLAWMMAVGLAAALAMTLTTDHADARRPVLYGRWLPVVTPRVVTAEGCGQTITVHFDATTPGSDHQILPLADRGDAALWLLDAAGRNGVHGQWTRYPHRPPSETGRPPSRRWTDSGGEGILRWPYWRAAGEEGAQIVQVKVEVAGWKSLPAWIETGCGS